jgi:hypothetical protein
VLDERVIDERINDGFEVQYLPEIRTMMPPPSVEYVEVLHVCECLCAKRQVSGTSDVVIDMCTHVDDNIRCS